MSAFAWVMRLRLLLILASVAAASVGARWLYTHWALAAPATPGPLTYTITPSQKDIHDGHSRHDMKVGVEMKNIGPRSLRVAVIVLAWLAFVFLADHFASQLRVPWLPERDPLVRLRPVSDADVELFFEHQRQPEANHMASFPPRDRKAFFAHWEKIRKDPEVVIRTIECAGGVAGNIAAFKRANLREVCYWLGREHWGKGLATDALLRFLKEVKERPLYARIAKTNVASLRVAGKCGFAIVGEDRYTDAVGDGVEEYLLELRS